MTPTLKIKKQMEKAAAKILSYSRTYTASHIPFTACNGIACIKVKFIQMRLKLKGNVKVTAH